MSEGTRCDHCGRFAEMKIDPMVSERYRVPREWFKVAMGGGGKPFDACSSGCGAQILQRMEIEANNPSKFDAFVRSVAS